MTQKDWPISNTVGSANERIWLKAQWYDLAQQIAAHNRAILGLQQKASELEQIINAPNGDDKA